MQTDEDAVGATLTADDFDTHAGMPMPRDRMKLDVTQYDDVIEVGVFDAVRVGIAFERLRHTVHSTIR